MSVIQWRWHYPPQSLHLNPHKIKTARRHLQQITIQAAVVEVATTMAAVVAAVAVVAAEQRLRRLHQTNLLHSPNPSLQKRGTVRIKERIR